MAYVVVAVLATLCAAMQCIVVRAPSTTWQRIWSPELGWCTWFSASSSHWLLSSCSGVRRGRRAALREELLETSALSSAAPAVRISNNTRRWTRRKVLSVGNQPWSEREGKQKEDLTSRNPNHNLKFLSDPGPIIVYPCQWLTHWLTDSWPCWRLNELT